MNQSFLAVCISFLILVNFFSCNLFQQKSDTIEVEPEIPAVISESKEEKWEEVASIIKPEPSYKLIGSEEKIKFHIEPRFGLVEPFRDKLAYVKFQEKKEVKEGYIDISGKIVIATNYDYPNYSFHYGLESSKG
jgi:hypothetical protein